MGGWIMYDYDCITSYTYRDEREYISRMDAADDNLRGILDMLYGNESLDVGKIEDYIDGLVTALEMDWKFPAHTPRIQIK